VNGAAIVGKTQDGGAEGFHVSVMPDPIRHPCVSALDGGSSPQ
jgi:hypothetical protein